MFMQLFDVFSAILSHYFDKSHAEYFPPLSSLKIPTSTPNLHLLP